MRKSSKLLASIMLVAMMTLSIAVGTAMAIPAGTLSIAGSSTVAPIARTAATTFVNYWNTLSNANPSWGAGTISAVTVDDKGSGTAIPAINNTLGNIATADIGEMSRTLSTSEWSGSLTTLQQYAIGIDSVAVVVSSDMTWFPTNLNTLQVAHLVVNKYESGAWTTTPYYRTWGDFLADYYSVADPATLGLSGYTTQINNTAINRAIRDGSSGTFECFNNYFIKTNSYDEGAHYYSIGGSGEHGWSNQLVSTSTYCQENGDVYNTLTSGQDYIGFISLGYLLSYGNMIGMNISFTQRDLSYPGDMKYYPAQWGDYVAPSTAHVIDGTYKAWRWLWQVVTGPLQASGSDLIKGVYIAYCKNATLNGGDNAVKANHYIEMSRGDFAGGSVFDSNLVTYTPLAGQTSKYPDQKVNGADFFYFVDCYIAYWGSNTYNPYADFNADGKIMGADFFGFVDAYIAYWTTYNPP
jgi:ABC-type phosphate transport system substrate-binding protein